MVSIEGLSKAAVLAALYNGSKPQGFGFFHYDPEPMTEAVAENTIANQGMQFDYLKGRVMKIDIGGNELNTWGYNRDNGENAAEDIINLLRKTSDVNAEQIEMTHLEHTHQSAQFAKEHIAEPSKTIEGKDFVIHTLGLESIAPYIQDKIDDILDE